MFSSVKILFLVGVTALAGFMLYDAFKGPEPVIIGHGKIVTKSNSSSKPVERPTRQVSRGTLNYWQVQSLDGGWIDCGKDCAETYRRKVLDYWDTRSEDSGR